MRYFRYKNTGRNINNALREHYKALTEDEQRTFRREKRWRKCSTAVSCVLYVSFVAAGLLLLRAIPLPEAVVLRVLVIAGEAVAGVFLLILGGVFAVAFTMPLWKKVESFRIPAMKKEIFSKACGHLRTYYGLKAPYIITKCFEATDKRFQNHDVCIFIVGDELRITADLVRGFLHGERDLGCYAFRRDEITVSKRQDGDRRAAELRAGDAVFTLGYRAKGYIEKGFLIPESE